MMAHDDPFAADHPTADVFVFLASHDREGSSMFVTLKTGAVWFMADRTGEVLTGGANQAPIEGYHQSAALSTPMAPPDAAYSSDPSRWRQLHVPLTRESEAG